MWFKNLQIYRLSKPFDLSPEELHEKLQQEEARECDSLEMSTMGWVQPLGRNAELFTHAVGSCIMMCARRDERILPAAVVREHLVEKVAAIEEAEARKVRRREREEIKDEILTDLMPRSFTKSSTTYAYVDTKGGWLVVDAASAKRAEELITLLRETIGTLPLKPLEVAQSPAYVMTSWLKGVDPAADFLVQDECELRDTVEEGGIIRCRRQDLEGEEIRVHLDAGKQVVRLAVEWHERLSLVLTEEMSIKRLKFMDVIQEEAAEAETDDEAARFDVDFSLMTLELGRFIPRLVETFGGLAEEE
ncbi:recombination-associated protein RdgC [Solemya velesiana gill symbiont]|uniref:Recombination-associated protein RdgC n=1 Tax=Solemya velesiana gill symbiont TaxID=1918948 RepID=A0A1T2KW16_9GAMM|nr:recombination-associated protein RdgC [Solemya velesiana gill symbiont]OOZ36991.1 recombination-associated protein RdgC [Solemya velesiana gill symbiont]